MRRLFLTTLLALVSVIGIGSSPAFASAGCNQADPYSTQPNGGGTINMNDELFCWGVDEVQGQDLPASLGGAYQPIGTWDLHPLSYQLPWCIRTQAGCWVAGIQSYSYCFPGTRGQYAPYNHQVSFRIHNLAQNSWGSWTGWLGPTYTYSFTCS